MPRRNRVTPFSELVADPARGLVYGNRGCLHDEDGTIRRRYAGRRWIACRLEFRGWKRHALLQPGRFTELFFLDEATAFAAGHRPCALCRHEDYRRFVTHWRKLHPGDDARGGRDRRPAARGAGRARHTRAAAPRGAFETLPDGAFVVHDDAPGSCSASGCCAGRRRLRRSLRPRPRGRADRPHAAVARRRPRGGLAAGRAAAAPLGRSARVRRPHG